MLRVPIIDESKCGRLRKYIMNDFEDFLYARQRFVQMLGVAGFGVLMNVDDLFMQYSHISPVKTDNPLADYPLYGWELQELLERASVTCAEREVAYANG